MSWGVWCTVSGGVTGPRAAWLKDQGVRVELDTREEAEEEARWNRERMNDSVSAKRGVVFTYEPRRIA